MASNYFQTLRLVSPSNDWGSVFPLRLLWLLLRLLWAHWHSDSLLPFLFALRTSHCQVPHSKISVNQKNRIHSPGLDAHWTPLASPETEWALSKHKGPFLGPPAFLLLLTHIFSLSPPKYISSQETQDLLLKQEWQSECKQLLSQLEVSPIFDGASVHREAQHPPSIRNRSQNQRLTPFSWSALPSQLQLCFFRQWAASPIREVEIPLSW